jgi:hypothetical protein
MRANGHQSDAQRARGFIHRHRRGDDPGRERNFEMITTKIARVIEIILVIVFLMICGLAGMQWLVDLFYAAIQP